MHLKLIADFHSLLLCERQWDEVAGSFPLFRHAWLISWMEHLGKSARPAVLVAVEDASAGSETESWLAIAPLCIETNGLARKLCWLGSGPACTDYQRIICQPEHSKTFSRSVADWVAANIGTGKPLGRIDLVELDGADASDAATNDLIDGFKQNDFQLQALEVEGCWKVDLPGTWEELNCQFSKSMRRKTKKAVQRLDDSATAVRSSKDGQLEGLWKNFVALHQKRRNMLGQQGCFANPDFEMFLWKAVERLVSSGHAELVEILYESQPLASMLLLNDGQEVLMYQSGSCDRGAHLEPGYQMVALAMRRSIEQGFQSFDFMRGDEPYKSRWNSRRVPLSRLRLIPPHVSAQLMQTLWAAGRSLKGCLGPFASGE